MATTIETRPVDDPDLAKKAPQLVPKPDVSAAETPPDGDEEEENPQPPVLPATDFDPAEPASTRKARKLREGVPRLPNIERKQITPKKFFDYWNETLTKKQQERVILYAYRNYPVIDKWNCEQCWAKVSPRKKGDKFYECAACGHKGKVLTYIDKVGEPFKLEDVIYRYGVGDYSFSLNDVVLSEKITYCKVETERDWESRPVIDVREVDMADPKNQTYIQKLRAWGELKDPDKEDDEMSGSAALIDKQTERIIELSKENAAAKKPVEADLGTAAGQSALKVISDAAAMGNKMISDAQTKAIEAMAKKGEQADPMAMFNSVLTAVEKMVGARTPPANAPSAASDPIIMEMREAQRRSETRIAELERERQQMIQKQLETEKKRADDAEAEIKRLRENPPAAQAAAKVEIPKDPMAEMDRVFTLFGKLTDMQNKLKTAFGGDDDGDKKSAIEEADEAGKLPPPGKRTLMDYIPIVMQAGAYIMQQFGVAKYNEAIASGHATGAAVAPGAAPIVAPDVVDAAAKMGLTGGTAAAGAPASAPSLNLSDLDASMAMVERPLLECLAQPDDDLPGFQFAQKFIHWAGRTNYDIWKERGKTGLINAFRMYHPVWAVMSLIPVKAEKFVDDFLLHDKHKLEFEQREEDEDDEEDPRDKDYTE